ncbi:RPA family protein [Halarchaeum solikamskense]|uniref:hypothetical protein n=1 Tax=Halarchaeum nitratireducens TaxID=489913 RepID=UPI001FD8B9BC|nr:hypothetical protein [Halarchaeum solikamskense]MBP2250730.1 RPA family protein [Halarchaeum solikamskense]
MSENSSSNSNSGSFGDDGEERPSREVAWRLFAAEFDDADYQYAESDEERAPNYVVTPTGARVNRLFAVGVLTSVEQVNEDVVRARVVDPTGAFVVYAGQYQPDALASLENADVPSFVAVTGKARTFSPEDSEQVYTSIRPESVNAVTSETRDRWVVTAAERTLARVSTFADALDMPERGDELTDALVARDVPYGLASGISHAIDHYGTTPAYLAAVRELALDASRVVAGERDEVEALALAPNEGDGTDADLSYAGAELAEVETAEATMDEHVEATAEGEPVTETTEPSPDDVDADGEAPAVQNAERADGDVDAADTPASEATESEPEEPATTDVETARTEATPEGETVTETTAPSPDDVDNSEESAVQNAEHADVGVDDEESALESGEDEQWEMDEETRNEVEAEFDVGFSTGNDIPEGGESDLAADEEPAADEPAAGVAESASESGGASDLGDFDASTDFGEDEEDADDLNDFTASEYDEPESDAEDAEAAPPDVDLEDLVVDYMDDLDDGDGADRDDLVRTVLEETEADESEIADAIQSALMSGRCYESGEDHLKAI